VTGWGGATPVASLEHCLHVRGGGLQGWGRQRDKEPQEPKGSRRGRGSSSSSSSSSGGSHQTRVADVEAAAAAAATTDVWLAVKEHTDRDLNCSITRSTHNMTLLLYWAAGAAVPPPSVVAAPAQEHIEE
jgi:hypothetical protein